MTGSASLLGGNRPLLGRPALTGRRLGRQAWGMGLFTPNPEKLEAARDRLLAEIEANARETESWTGRPRFSDAVMAAMARVPRHQFVRPDDIAAAYANRPQAIGFGQTISQPYIVALMSDLLDLKDTSRVLEIGTGSGIGPGTVARRRRTEQVNRPALTGRRRRRQACLHGLVHPL